MLKRWHLFVFAVLTALMVLHLIDDAKLFHSQHQPTPGTVEREVLAGGVNEAVCTLTVFCWKELSLFTGDEVERMVCGKPEVDIDLLEVRSVEVCSHVSQNTLVESWVAHSSSCMVRG